MPRGAGGVYEMFIWFALTSTGSFSFVDHI